VNEIVRTLEQEAPGLAERIAEGERQAELERQRWEEQQRRWGAEERERRRVEKSSTPGAQANLTILDDSKGPGR